MSLSVEMASMCKVESSILTLGRYKLDTVSVETALLNYKPEKHPMCEVVEELVECKDR